MGAEFNQFCIYTRTATVLETKELRNKSRTWPPMLNTYSRATIVIEMTKISFIIMVKAGYWVELTLHQFKKSRLPVRRHLNILQQILL